MNIGTNDFRKDLLVKTFAEKMSGGPTVCARAPGRVELMGSHTDYNEGFVLTMAIDRDTWVAGRRRNDGVVRVHSVNLDETRSFSIDTPVQSRDWSAYVQGVVSSLLQAGYDTPGFDAVIHGDVPLGGGLSSSASFSAATAVFVTSLADHQPDRLTLAQLCQQAENQVVGVPCGILDPFSSLFGESDHVMLLDCRALTCEQFRVPATVQIVICDTCAPRQLSNSAYAERRAECETGARILAETVPGIKTLRDVTADHWHKHADSLPTIIRKRCGYVIAENQRVLDMAQALAADDRSAIRELCAASFYGADSQYEIVTSEMTAMRTAATTAHGAIGVRNSGGGFGGCLVAFVESSKTDAFIESTTVAYQTTTGITPQVFPVTPANGAGLI